MDQLTSEPRVSPALARLREATADLHRGLDSRMDAVARLCDPDRRAALIRRYADFHIPAETALATWLQPLAALEFAARRRSPLLHRFAGERALPPFPAPASRAEALGMLYVLEGSTLGGRMILREVAARGVEDADLAFLDPYGKDTGARWRSFLSLLAGEIGDDPARLEAATSGALRAFEHAGNILCERQA